MPGMLFEPLLMQKSMRKSLSVIARPGKWCWGMGMMDKVEGRAIDALGNWSEIIESTASSFDSKIKETKKNRV